MSGYRPLALTPPSLGLNVSGRIYSVPGTSVTTHPSNNLLHLMPVWLPEAVTIDQLSAEITVAGEAGATLRLGAYKMDENGFTLLTDTGALAADVTGFVSGEVGVTLPPGLIAFAAVAQNAPTTRPTVRAVSGENPWVYRTGSLHEYHCAFSQSGVTGALPASPNPGTINRGIRVWWRVA